MSHLLEKNRNKNGKRMIIAKYNDKNDVTVVFSDNTRARTTYKAFWYGEVVGFLKNPLGKVVTDKDGITARVVEYNNNVSTVQYADGQIVSGIPDEAIAFGDFTAESEVFEPKTRNIDEIRELTYKNARYCLNRYRKCVIERPCGFGKTTIALRIFDDYERCLFLHHEKDDLNAKKVEDNVDTMTFAAIRMLTKKQIEALNYDFVFIDEVHNIGGDEDGNGAVVTYNAIKHLMETHPKTHFLGATATPVRMDGIDVIDSMFGNHVVFPYTITDAIDDGLLKVPHYYYCIYNVVEKIRTKIAEFNKEIKLSREDVAKTLNISQSEIEEVDSKYMDKHIRKTCDKLYPRKNYLRFIAFYLTNEEIEKNKEKVVGWFKKAYPEWEINTMVVTSRTDKDLKDVDMLPHKPSKGYKGRVDIIFNCEMLVGGYHSEYLTGLILDRKTRSLTKYWQTIGRIMSFDSKEPAVIFDIVDNIHSDFIVKNQEVEDVELTFPEAMTFEELVEIGKDACDWEIIKRHSEEAAKKVERSEVNKISEVDKIEDTINSFESVSKMVNYPILAEEDDALKKVDYPILVEEDDISINYSIAEEVNEEDYREELETYEVPLYKPAVNCDDISGYISPLSMAAPDVSNCTRKAINTFQSAPYGGNIPKSGDILPLPVKAKEEPDGYSGNAYRNSQTGRVFLKSFEVENSCLDIEEHIRAFQEKVTAEQIKKIIKKWHTYPGCEENYTSYEEVNLKEPKYMFLKNISSFIYKVKPEDVIRYMVEGLV